MPSIYRQFLGNKFISEGTDGSGSQSQGIKLREPDPYYTDQFTYSYEYYVVDNEGTRWPSNNYYLQTEEDLLPDSNNIRPISAEAGTYAYELPGETAQECGWLLNTKHSITGITELIVEARFDFTNDRYLWVSHDTDESRIVISPDEISGDSINGGYVTLCTYPVITDFNDGNIHEFKIKFLSNGTGIECYWDGNLIGSSVYNYNEFRISGFGMKYSGTTSIAGFLGVLKSVKIIQDGVTVQECRPVLRGNPIQTSTIGNDLTLQACSATDNDDWTLIESVSGDTNVYNRSIIISQTSEIGINLEGDYLGSNNDVGTTLNQNFIISYFTAQPNGTITYYTEDNGGSWPLGENNITLSADGYTKDITLFVGDTLEVTQDDSLTFVYPQPNITGIVSGSGWSQTLPSPIVNSTTVWTNLGEDPKLVQGDNSVNYQLTDPNGDTYLSSNNIVMRYVRDSYVIEVDGQTDMPNIEFDVSSTPVDIVYTSASVFALDEDDNIAVDEDNLYGYTGGIEVTESINLVPGSNLIRKSLKDNFGNTVYTNLVTVNYIE